MNIRQIEVENFKGLKHIKINSFGNVNLFIGKNNSGKSSLLQLLALIGRTCKTNGFARSFSFCRTIPELFNEPSKFISKLTLYNLETYDFTIHNLNTSDQTQFIFTAPTNHQQAFRTVYIEPSLDLGTLSSSSPGYRRILDFFEEGSDTNYSGLQLMFALKAASEQKYKNYSANDYQQVKNSILKYFPEIKDLDAFRDGEDVAKIEFIEDSYGKSLDIMYAGSGLQHFLDILIKIFVSKSKIVLLDEPERGLHPDQQRRLIELIIQIADEESLQFFIATHSPVILNYIDDVTLFKVANENSTRTITAVDKELAHTIYGDLGIRPSDFFNSDICLMVEGQSDVIYFEHVIKTLYKDEFEDCAISIQQYGGDALAGILKGSIKLEHITTVQKYSYWIHDKDSAKGIIPSTHATKIINKLIKFGVEAKILNKRDIEYYYLPEMYVSAQQNDEDKVSKALEILNGNQEKSFKDAAEEHSICVPTGKYLRRLLKAHLKDKEQLDPEIKSIVEEKLIPWKDEILAV